jgi:hypothetical protein
MIQVQPNHLDHQLDPSWMLYRYRRDPLPCNLRSTLISTKRETLTRGLPFKLSNLNHSAYLRRCEFEPASFKTLMHAPTNAGADGHLRNSTIFLAELIHSSVDDANLCANCPIGAQPHGPLEYPPTYRGGLSFFSCERSLLVLALGACTT